jgi:hypothetical protein
MVRNDTTSEDTLTTQIVVALKLQQYSIQEHKNKGKKSCFSLRFSAPHQSIINKEGAEKIMCQ